MAGLLRVERYGDTDEIWKEAWSIGASPKTRKKSVDVQNAPEPAVDRGDEQREQEPSH